MSTRVLVSVCGASAVLGFFCGLYVSRKWTKKPKAEGVRVNSCVLFFPDNQTAASQDLTRQEKGQIYKEILNYSRPLKHLEKVLKSAKVSIDLCLFTITCHKLGYAALERLENANVKVRLIVDEQNANLDGSLVPTFRQRGAFVRMKKSDYLMHHKFAIIDGQEVLTGSFNWTMQAVMGNQENVIISDDPELVDAFVQHFEKMWTEYAP